MTSNYIYFNPYHLDFVQLKKKNGCLLFCSNFVVSCRANMAKHGKCSFLFSSYQWSTFLNKLDENIFKSAAIIIIE